MTEAPAYGTAAIVEPEQGEVLCALGQSRHSRLAGPDAQALL